MQVPAQVYALCCLTGLTSIAITGGSSVQRSLVSAVDGSSSRQGTSPLCGTLDYDLLTGFASFRWVDQDEVAAWTLKFCTFRQPVHLYGIQWIGSERPNDAWRGIADWVIWDQKTVEQGCADNQSALLLEENVRNRGEFVQNTFGFDIFRYEIDLDVTLDPGGYYFGVRNVIAKDGLSFIITSDCQGDKPLYFQSEFFGFPCAVPGRDVFGEDYCVAVAVFGEQFVDCDKVHRVKARARCEKEKVVAAVMSRLAEGTVLTLTLDGDRPVEVVIDENGKARARWRGATGGEVCIAECPDRCATPDPCK